MPAMDLPVSRRQSGEWVVGTSAGGCPKHDSWPINPQFRLTTTAPSATYSIRLASHAAYGKAPIGLFVLRTSGGAPGRVSALTKKDIAHKGKWKHAESVDSEVELIGPAVYIVIPSTFDPGVAAAFELSAASTTEFDLVELPATVAPTVASPPDGSAKAVAASGDDLSVRVEPEGQGLSQRQQRDAEAAVAKALKQCNDTGQPYQDADFAPSKRALWLDGVKPSVLAADPVATWRRPAEFAPGATARVFHNDWQIQGVVPGLLPNRDMLAGANIVGGDQDVIARAFVDAEHASKGFYVLRFYVDDPHSDDDWAVVIVDDRLPCGADGKLCFARCPSEGVLWVALVEKGLAKLRGCYEATCHVTTDESLMLLTGGLSRAIEAPPATRDELWQKLTEAWNTSHVVGVCHVSDRPDDGPFQGLEANVHYCALTGGDMQACGKMVRLRGFHGASEWTGKWSDNDPTWTNHLRQMLSFSKDATDGTFWMAFDDFAGWFNRVSSCRAADDRWTKMTVRSRWEDATAGGSYDCIGWVGNNQWLLRAPRRTRILASLTLPAPPAGGPPPRSAVGVCVLRGNRAPDDRRRKLLLADGDVVDAAAPRVSTRSVFEWTLEPSTTPYVIMPYAHTPGFESPFTLVLRSDDRDDDGKPDFEFGPVRPEDDWRRGAMSASWKPDEGAGGPPGGKGFLRNPRLHLRLSGSAPADGGRFFIIAESINVATDMRAEAGLQTSPSYPPIGLAVSAADADEPLHVMRAEPKDGVMLSCRLAPAVEGYMLRPFLGTTAEPSRHPGLAWRVSVYSDVEFELGPPPEKCGDDACDYKCADCPMFEVFERLQKLEDGIARHVSLLHF